MPKFVPAAPRGTLEALTGPVRWSGTLVLTGEAAPSTCRPRATTEQEVAMSDDRAETANLLKAIEFASRKHSTQRRKDQDASPYINHPITVTHLLADTGGSPTS